MSASMKRKSEEDKFIVEDKEYKKEVAKENKKAKGKGTEDESGEKVEFDLGAKRKISVGAFKGNLLINIREYYDDKNTGEEKPGSKGIALTLKQWNELKTHIEDVDKAIAASQE